MTTKVENKLTLLSDTLNEFFGDKMNLARMGQETLLKLWFRVREYLFRLKHTKESLVEGEEYYIDMLEDHYNNCVSSTVTVHSEIDNFKLSEPQ